MDRLRSLWERVPMWLRIGFAGFSAVMTILGIPSVGENVAGWGVWLGFAGSAVGQYVLLLLGLLGLMAVFGLHLAEVRVAHGHSPRSTDATATAGASEVPAQSLREALRTAQRDGKALAGEAATLEPVGNFELLDDLIRRYNNYEERVADLLASNRDELSPRWRVEWLRGPEWHSSQVAPISREQFDGMARMIGYRVRLIDGMIRELEEGRP